MASLTDGQLEAAAARGREMLRTDPRAAAASYDRITGRVSIDLVNGCTYAFPAQSVQDLNAASDGDLAGIVVDGAGFNLNWPALEVDLHVPALIAGVFGPERGWRVNWRGWRVRQPRPPKPRPLGRTARKAAAQGRPPATNDA